MTQIQNLTIQRPDDWHVHFRDGEMLEAVVPMTARQFARAIVMPNLTPPITTVKMAIEYRKQIIQAVPDGINFEPLMTYFLTDNYQIDEIVNGFKEKIFSAVKLYPENATTNSGDGVSDIAQVAKVFSEMEKIGMPLLVHGETTRSKGGKEIDVFDREKVFIENTLNPLIKRFPDLKVVLEHISTEEAVSFIGESEKNLAATITPQHLILNRNAIFHGGIRPHMFCLPIAKREKDRLALRRAATSGSKKYFLGTDSAPHTTAMKESSCGCAGIFSAKTALELYLEVFEEEGALNNFELFASKNGPNFYNLPINKETISFRKISMRVPEEIIIGKNLLKPFRSGEEISWSIVR